MIKKLARINKVNFNDGNPIITFLQNNLYPPDQMRNRAKHLRSKFASLEGQYDLTHKCVLFKFGSSHLLKTKNTAGFVDLGELVNTYSLSKNIKACFVGIFPVSGKLGLPMPIQGKKEKIFDINDSNYYRAENTLFKAIKNDNKFSVFNLRGLKEKYGSAIEPHSYLNELIENYDVLIFIQNTSPAEL